jgi:hypothetical protein
MKNNQLFIYGGIGILVVVAIVVFFMTKKKEPYVFASGGSSAGTADNSLTLTSDASGNLSTVASVPVGTIVAFYSNSYNIPKGWALCDGTNGTPDLTGKSLVGSNGDVNTSGSTIQPGNTIYAGTTITPANLPGHTHGGFFYGTTDTSVGTVEVIVGVPNYAGDAQPITTNVPFFGVLWIMKIR